MEANQQRQGLQAILDGAVQKGIHLFADALRDIENVREPKRADSITQAVVLAEERYRQERDAFCQYWMDSPFYR